jgi:hypothetical protein
MTYEILHVQAPDPTQEQMDEWKARTVEMWRQYSAFNPGKEQTIWEILTNRGGELIYGPMPDA